MASLDFINYKDSFIYMKECNANWGQNNKICYCCKKPIKDGKILMVINNNRYFPNILIHPDCYSKHKNNPEKLFAKIEENYKSHKEMRQIF